MSYTALYRKFRPQTFSEVKGQESIVTTLKNQIETGRIGHAYLFCGTRGTGKTSVAKLFAKAVNCEHRNGADPCGECPSCVAASTGASSNIIEIDAASNNSVDDVRNIREEVAYRPTEGRYKVYIIDEAHMLSQGAFNALLKTLEEPPEYVIFILATTESAKLPVTIVSRCQRYDFRRIGLDVIAARIRELLTTENIQAEEQGVRYIARLADGSMRDALSLLERCVSGCTDGNLRYDDIIEILGTVDSEGFASMFEAIQEKDVTGAIRSLEDYALSGKDMASFASGFTWYLRNLLLAKNAEGIEDLLDVSTEEFAYMRRKAEETDDNTLMRYIRVFSELTGKLRTSVSRRVDVEMTIIRLCRPAMENDTQSLAVRIRELEKTIEDLKTSGPVIVQAARETEDAAEVQKEEAAPVPPQKAAPEQLQRIHEKWYSIISRTKGAVKASLQGSEPLYDGKNGGDTLYVRLANDTLTEHMKIGSAEVDELIQEIEKAAGGTVEVRFVSREDKNTTGSLSPIKAFENAKKLINMPIDTID